MSSNTFQPHPVVRRVLKRLGVTGESEVQNFLFPQLNNLPSPDTMLDLEKGAALIGNGILARQPILVWGDYDVDGVTATALLLQFFKAIGYADVQYYIPNRLKEGYGLQPESLCKISSTVTGGEGRILVTVDNGISAHDGVEIAKRHGFTVVVTDHHVAPAKRVQADAVINPMQRECPFPEKALAGVGVAFYLVIALRAFLLSANYFSRDKGPPNLKQFLGLVAVGTVADLVPMDPVNRILVRGGFESVANKDNVGLQSLCAASNLDHTTLRTEDIAFLLAPKINAAGRMGDADAAIKLLTAPDSYAADSYAAELEKLNELRKNVVLRDLAKVKDERCDSLYVCKSVVVAAGHFHIGIAGIVASKLAETYGKPSFVLCAAHEIYKGSARSIDGVNLYNSLHDCKELLSGYGGHAMAAGLSLNKNNLELFVELLDNSIGSQMKKEPVGQKIEELCFDFPVPEMFNNSLLEQLLLLEPHGVGNPQPVFRDHVSGLSRIRQIGKDKSHLSFTINNGSSAVYAIGFGLGELYESCMDSGPKVIRYSPTLNLYNGHRSWQARVVEIKGHGGQHTDITK